MSTQSVADEADAAINSLLDLDVATKASVKKLRKEKEAALKKKEQIARAARIAARRVQDGVDDIDEQLGQLDPDAAPPAPPEPPAAPPAPPEPTPPAEPAPAATLPLPVNAPPEPQEALGLPPAQPVPKHQYNPVNPRNWGLIQWLFAVLGLIVMLAIASWNWDWWYRDWVFNIGTIFGILMSSVFWSAPLVIGFFGGGLIGYAIDRRRLRRHGVDIEVVIQQRRERRRIAREQRLEQYRQALPVPPAEPPVA